MCCELFALISFTIFEGEEINYIDFLEVVCCLRACIQKAMSILPLKSEKLTKEQEFNIQKFEYLVSFITQSRKVRKGDKKRIIQQSLKDFNMTKGMLKLIRLTIRERNLKFRNQLKVVLDDLIGNL